MCVIAVAFCVVVRTGPAPIASSPAQQALQEALAANGESGASAENTASQPGGFADEGQNLVVAEAQPIQAEYVPETVLVGIADGTTIDQVNERLAQLDYVATKSVSEDDVMFGYVKLDLAEGVQVEDAIAQLEATDFASAAQPDYIYHLLDTTEADATALQAASVPGGLTAETAAQSITVNDTLANDQWALEAIHAHEAWDYVKTSRMITVAVLDTGANVDHEDLAANIVAPYSVKNESSDVTDVNKSGHGTHIVGIVAAMANNNKGVAGVSYNANVMPVQISNDADGTASSSDIAAGAAYILKYIEEHPEANVKVANLSFGKVYELGEQSDQQCLNSLRSLNNAGVLVICAAGNYSDRQSHDETKNDYYEDGQDRAYVCFPCDFDSSFVGVINVAQTVSGNTTTYDRAKGSNFNMSNQTTKDMSAPGTLILSTLKSGDYGYMSGTSMAAPCVAGVAALVFAVDPTLTPARVQAILHETATDINAEGPDPETGYGMVNAAAAVQEAGAPVISGANALAKGATCQLSIEYAFGTPIWTWSSSDANVAVVNQSGEVTGVGAGTATISAKAATKSTTFDINVYDPAISGADTVEYGSSITLAVPSSNPLNATWQWSSSDKTVAIGKTTGVVAGLALGEAEVSVTLASPTVEGDATDTKAVTVVPANLAGATVTGVEDQVYAGDQTKLPNLKVTMPGWSRNIWTGGYQQTTKTLIEGVDYDVVYDLKEATGAQTVTATVTIKGKGNYTGEYSSSFQVGANTISDSQVSASKVRYTYTGKPIVLEDLVVKSADGVVLVEGQDYRADYSENVDVGNGYGYVTIVGINKYVGEVTRSFYIEAINIASDAVVLDEASIVDKTYTGKAITQDLKLTYNGMTLVEGVDYEVGYSPHVNATGAVTMQIAGLGNYYTTTTTYIWGVIPVSQRDIRDVAKTFAILPASLSSIELQPATFVADGTQKSPAVVVKGVDGVVLAEGTDYTLAVPGGRTEAGKYEYVATGAGNYTGAVRATLEITPAPVVPDPQDDPEPGGGSDPQDDPEPDDDPINLADYAGYAANKSGLTDLDPGQWYMQVGENKGSFPGTQTLYLDYTLANGLMSGYRDADGVVRRFGPDNPLSRAEAATIIYRLANPDSVDTSDPARYASSNTTGMADVESGKYYTAAVNWCVSKGIITGFQFADHAEFRPYENISREQIATIVARYRTTYLKGAQASGDITAYKDYAQISGWARAGVSYCMSKGIMSGYGNSGLFLPQERTNRAQMAKIIAVVATAP